MEKHSQIENLIGLINSLETSPYGGLKVYNNLKNKYYKRLKELKQELTTLEKDYLELVTDKKLMLKNYQIIPLNQNSLI
jgi:ABC-type oligopeptide transport system substrate-binding subunit